MTRTFLMFAVVCGLTIGSMTMVGCGDTAAVNKAAPANPGPAPADDSAAEDAVTVEN